VAYIRMSSLGNPGTRFGPTSNPDAFVRIQGVTHEDVRLTYLPGLRRVSRPEVDEAATETSL